MKKSRVYIISINPYKIVSGVLVLLSCSLPSSCSLIMDLDNVDNNLPNKEESFDKPNFQTSLKSSDVLLTNDPEIVKHYQSLLKNVKSDQLTVVDKLVIMAMIQMNLRPDLASPSSNLHVITNINGHNDYKSYQSTSNQSWPYLLGLEELLATHKSKFKLGQFATWLDQFGHQSKIAGAPLASFLKENKDKLSKDTNFKKYFFRAEQPIGVGESLPHLEYSKLLKKFSAQNRKMSRYNPLSDYKGDFNIQEKKISIRCNEYFAHYDQSKYSIRKKENPVLSLGIMDSNSNFVMIISSQDLSNVSSFKDSFLINAPSAEDCVSLCFIENLSSKNQFTVVSSGSRDPGQLIYHLIQYEISGVKSLGEISEYINFPRHLFLLNPLRMLYESERGTNKQLNRFLSMNFPIYHADSIGNIWVHAKFEDKEETGVVLDSRAKYFSAK